MRAACEALRLTGEDGLAVSEEAVGRTGRLLKGGAREQEMEELRSAAGRQKEVGRLYRIAMMKGGVWDGVPIEYARGQTETPPRSVLLRFELAEGFTYS